MSACLEINKIVEKLDYRFPLHVIGSDNFQL